MFGLLIGGHVLEWVCIENGSWMAGINGIILNNEPLSTAKYWKLLTSEPQDYEIKFPTKSGASNGKKKLLCRILN